MFVLSLRYLHLDDLSISNRLHAASNRPTTSVSANIVRFSFVFYLICRFFLFLAYSRNRRRASFRLGFDNIIRSMNCIYTLQRRDILSFYFCFVFSNWLTFPSIKCRNAQEYDVFFIISFISNQCNSFSSRVQTKLTKTNLDVLCFYFIPKYCWSASWVCFLLLLCIVIGRCVLIIITCMSVFSTIHM